MGHQSRKRCIAAAAVHHKNFNITDSGLVIDPDFPYLGASPDGCISCDCCGSGVIEIKCPYSCAETSVREAVKMKNFCLECGSNGSFVLPKTHAYYFQVQAQIFLCKARYCDFTVWSPKDHVVLQIEPDTAFIMEAIERVTQLFKRGVTPELLGKWYSRMSSSLPMSACSIDSHELPSDSGLSDEIKWCYCKGDDEDEMICCDNESCPIQWFHTACLKITHIPKGNWYCPNCRKREA